MLVFRGTSPKCGLSRRVPSGPGAEGTQRAGKGGAVRAARGSCSPRAANQRLRRLRGAGPRGSGKMAAVGGGGIGPGGGPGARRGSTGRDAEAEVWCRRVRELVSAVPANRLCFECGQRGVTYVDISVGSLVCTGCSGALRGLNPPHRVKSISMTTFTEAEVLFLQAHGNEACRRIWLGTFNPRTSLLPDSCDPQKVKEFLQEKYEKKRWYVAPEQVKPPQSTTVEPRPLQALHGDTGTLPQVRPAHFWGCQGECHPLTLRCPPSPAQLPTTLPSQLERPAPTSWLPLGETPSLALPQHLPSLFSLVRLHRVWPPLFHPQGEELLPASLGPSVTPQRCPMGATPTHSWPPWPPDPSPTPSRATAPVPLFLEGSPVPSRLMVRVGGKINTGTTSTQAPSDPLPISPHRVAFQRVQRCQSFHQPLRDGPDPDGAVQHRAPDHQPLPVTADAGGGLSPALTAPTAAFGGSGSAHHSSPSAGTTFYFCSERFIVII
ncbi:arf-GAP domain and FG repeat-containing protein 2 isoform X4 [Cinclus cinclus]|uniref:arf-GAP domain and FG repeat-containing protein 2 isoform X4 n=1 Tax=Cinclus cinclus TaxID=127875 RepID=UPI002E12BCA8